MTIGKAQSVIYEYQGAACTVLRTATIEESGFFGFVCWARRGMRIDESRPFEVHLYDNGELVATLCYDSTREVLMFWSGFLSGLCAEIAAGALTAAVSQCKVGSKGEESTL